MQQIQEQWMSGQITDEQRKLFALLLFMARPDVDRRSKYYWIYRDIITKKYPEDAVTEDHHIYPDCLEGSSDLPCNIVKLPVRHHFVAHLCLARCTTGRTKYKMNSACNLFSKKRKGRVSSRVIETIRALNAETVSKRLKGRAKTEDHRQKISRGSIGTKKNYTPESLAQRIEKYQKTRAEREIPAWNKGQSMADSEHLRKLSTTKSKGRAFVVIEPDNTTYLIPTLASLYFKQRGLWIETVNTKLRESDVAMYRDYTIRRYESLAEARDAFFNAIEWSPEIEPKIFEYDKSAAMTGKVRGPYKSK